MQVARLDQERQLLTARVSQTQNGCSQLAMQLKETRERWQITCLTNATLHKELMALRDVWQVPCSCTLPHQSETLSSLQHHYFQGHGHSHKDDCSRRSMYCPEIDHLVGCVAITTPDRVQWN